MSESVAQADEAPSPEVETPEVETPTTDFEAEATEYKNRFAGSQKKLTETLNERKALAAEVEALRKFKAEAERANMTELERIAAERDEARNEAAAARQEAQRERLARQFPLAVEFYGDEPLPSEAKLQALQERLAGELDETERTPRIDPNNPRRSVAEPRARTIEDVRKDIQDHPPIISDTVWR